MRLFLDANVLFSAALSPEGAAWKLFAFAEAGVCELVTSAFAVAEVARNLRVKAPEAVDRWERSSASVGIVAEADPRLVERLAVPLPAKDRPILAAAIGCRATVLVTGDRRHFGPSFGRAFGGTVVLSPREALAFFGRSERGLGGSDTRDPRPALGPNVRPHGSRASSTSHRQRSGWFAVAYPLATGL